MNTDGSPLTDLAGYNFYLGTATGAYAIFIPNIPPTETQYDVTNLVVPGTTYYCVVTALNTAGIESAYSNELVFTVAAPLQSNPPANVGYTP
jgi:hypothetical protein